MSGRPEEDAGTVRRSMFGEVISTYTRREATRDGVLVDVSKMAREAGFGAPVAVTRAVFDAYVRVPKGVPCQDESGRLWDILWMFQHSVRSGENREARELLFQVLVRNDRSGPKPVTLKAVSGPGDRGELVITIMLPDED